MTKWIHLNSTYTLKKSGHYFNEYIYTKRKLMVEKQIKTPHPHGALMMEYAKECLIDVEAWRNWEITYDGVNWVSINKSPCWYTDCYYRRKQRVKD